MKNKLYPVSEEIFSYYVRKHGLKAKAGSVFHSTYYVNDKDEVMAYEESSSWNPYISYMIADEAYENLETAQNLADLITNKFLK